LVEQLFVIFAFGANLEYPGGPAFCEREHQKWRPQKLM
jgi:hypothetical protein